MFKKYDQKQQFLLPLNLEEFVSEDHISRVINELFDVFDISAIESTYSEKGCPAYHPRLLLKILFYGYMISIRSSRKVDDMTQTDTAFMYLAAMQKPDFHTICRFRSNHLDAIKKIFSQVVTLCKEMDLIGSSISIDGTKVKANASETLGYKPTIVLADAGYFSYDNVQFLLDEEIDAYIPDNFYEVEKRGKTKKFRKLLFTYDVKKDCYYCPAAFEIPFTRIQKRENEPDLRHYVCKYCSLCVLKNACTDSKNRTITRDPREHLMEDMRAKLNTEEGTEQYQNRMCTVEPVFGQMKQDRGFREFLLRGKRKTKIEFIMMCTVHNIKKIADFIKRKSKSLKEILNMIAVGGSLGWNQRGILARIANMLC